MSDYKNLDKKQRIYNGDSNIIKMIQFKVINVTSYKFRNEKGVYQWATTFKYYIDGDCACSAKKAKWVTDEKPTQEMLKEHARALESKPIIIFNS